MAGAASDSDFDRVNQSIDQSRNDKQTTDKDISSFSFPAKITNWFSFISLVNNIISFIKSYIKRLYWSARVQFYAKLCELDLCLFDFEYGPRVMRHVIELPANQSPARTSILATVVLAVHLRCHVTCICMG